MPQESSVASSEVAIRTTPSVPLLSLICVDDPNEQAFGRQVGNIDSMVIDIDYNEFPVSRKATVFICKRVSESKNRTTTGTMRRLCTYIVSKLIQTS